MPQTLDILSNCDIDHELRLTDDTFYIYFDSEEEREEAKRPPLLRAIALEAYEINRAVEYIVFCCGEKKLKRTVGSIFDGNR